MQAQRAHHAGKKWHHHVRDYVVPHKGNSYKPDFFSPLSIAIVIGIIFFVEAMYLASLTVAGRSGLFASVLPAAVYDLTNADRKGNGVRTLQYDDLLSLAAQMKANDMVSKGYFAHVSPEGKTPWDWFDTVGYQYSYAGENLAVNFTDSHDVETAWMHSPTHRDNIVKPQYTRIGVGVAQGIFNGKETTFVVQMFATIPKGAPDMGKLYASAKKNPLLKAPDHITPVVIAALPQETSHVLGAELDPLPPQGLAALFTSPLYLSLAFGWLFVACVFVLAMVTMHKGHRKHRVEIALVSLLIFIAIVPLLLHNATLRKDVEVGPQGAIIDRGE